MTKAEYAEYERAVADELGIYKIVSSGPCPGCDECGMPADSEDYDQYGEAAFSWSPCEICGSPLGGDRLPVHGVTDDGATAHYNACVDCYYYSEYGRLDDMTMDEMEGGEE